MEQQNTRIKLFAIAKDEAAYIPQWVHHHFYFGFDEIEIWLNNIEDNSIEVCQSLHEKLEGFSYVNADSFLEECVNENKNFQVEAYNFILKKELERDLITHILYLDLDEFWTPKDFSSTIKDIIILAPEADTRSFSWYFDSPLYDKLPFEKTYQKSLVIYKNNHVKSLVKISDKVRRVNIHNHSVDQGKNLLADGNVFDITESYQHNGALLREDCFEKNKNDVDIAFIYHNIFRSQLEYISSLLRGRKHANDTRVFKVNRIGYVIDPDSRSFKSSGELFFNIDSDKLNSYYKGYVSFLDEKQLLCELNIAQAFIIKRFNKVKAIISEDKTYRGNSIFRGIEFKFFRNINSSLKYCIDKVSITQKEVSIEGWSFLLNYHKPLNIKLLLKDSKRSKHLIDVSFDFVERINRPDVLNAYNLENPLQCGFNIRFSCNYEYLENKVSIYDFDENSNTITFLLKILP